MCLFEKKKNPETAVNEKMKIISKLKVKNETKKCM